MIEHKRGRLGKTFIFLTISILGALPGQLAAQQQEAGGQPPGPVVRGQDWRHAGPDNRIFNPPPDKTLSGIPTRRPDIEGLENDRPSSELAEYSGKNPVIWIRPKALAAAQVVSPGSMDKQNGKTIITFAEIAAPGADARCLGSQVEGARAQKGQAAGNAPPWACGKFARGALALLLGGRSIFCAPVKGRSRKIVTRCEVGGKDIALWLVRNGWASPARKFASGARKKAFNKALREARNQHRGIWHGKPPQLDSSAN